VLHEPILSLTEFLNNIVKQLWPHINAAGSKMVKEIVEPMFKTMLPGPLKTLHFTKIDLGPVPLRLSNALTTKTEVDGIKLDLNVDWVGKADIELDADMMPAMVSSCLLPAR
jgi:Ca2+-dependent lipid-binding protein